MASYEELQQAITGGQKDKAKEIVGVLLNSGRKPIEIISEGLIASMNLVGKRWKAGEMFIPEVIA